MASGNVNGNAAPEGPVRISHDEILHAHADDPPDATVADEAPATAIPASLRPPTAPISGVGQTIAQVGPNRALENGSDCWKRKSVLTLDGGGCRGYAQLLMLRALMERISVLEMSGDFGPAHDSSFCSASRTNTREPRPENSIEATPHSAEAQYLPCHYFDYMVGTSTGGLNAIQLGRLRMRLSDCIEAYDRMAKDVFGKPHIMGKGGVFRNRYDHERLRKQIENTVASRALPGSEDQRFTHYPSPKDLCKTIVIAIRHTADYFNPHIFRTYGHEGSAHDFIPNFGPANNHPIWQVARATSAADRYFRKQKIEGVKYSDGGFGYNNPSNIGCYEICRKEGGEFREGYHPIDILVSIGTGRQRSRRERVARRIPSLADVKLVKAFLDLRHRAKREATDVKKAHSRTAEKMRDKAYYRWDLPEEIGKMKLDEWKTDPSIGRSTKRRMEHEILMYIGQEDVSKALNECATNLVRLRRERIRDERRWKRFTFATRNICRRCHEEYSPANMLIEHIRIEHSDVINQDGWNEEVCIRDSEDPPAVEGGPY